ncbi:LysR substrate-binding domain-containing protein [Amycolatopsis minnesotensis]|uniref:LysR family transcriptional regulator n=1 Tax=Amycolatopsis minnesotensis TaxID=337894 RepID=A0ABN2RY04_9PSEU
MKPPQLLDGRLKIRHLTLVDALAEHGSVVRAADHLRITQPAATRSLRELEEIIGARLFDRGPRGITATTVGSAVVEHARAVLGHLRQASRHVVELNDADRGTVTVGTHLAGANLLVPRAIARLKRDHPELTVVVREDRLSVLHEDLLAGRLDLVVGRLGPTAAPSPLTQECLYDEPIRLVVRAGHAALGGHAPLSALAAHPWVFPLPGTGLRRELEDAFVHERVALPVDRVDCDSILTLRQLVLETEAVAALPALVAEEDDRFAVLPTKLPGVRLSVGVTLPAERPSGPATSAFLAHLHDVGACLLACADSR